MSVWEKFENIVSVEEVEELSKRRFEKPKAGQHNVELLAVEPSESSNGLPLVKFKFKDIDNKQFINCSMFLTNQFYPERNAQELNKVITVLSKLGNDIDFINMVDLEERIMATETGGKYLINLTYRNETTKYPNFEVINRIPDDVNDTFETVENEGYEELPF